MPGLEALNLAFRRDTSLDSVSQDREGQTHIQAEFESKSENCASVYPAGSNRDVFVHPSAFWMRDLHLVYIFGVAKQHVGLCSQDTI